jgi:F-type H+-transporting ATPase subunit epsilon
LLIINIEKADMFLEIITPDKKIYGGNVKLVMVPGSKGAFEILNNHAPIISTLNKGVIKVIEKNGNTLFFNVNGGLIENKANKIVVLVESA